MARRRDPMADLEQVVGMREHERPVVQVEDIELDQVAPALHPPPERPQGVLGLERGGALVADPEEGAALCQQGSPACARRRLRSRRAARPRPSGGTPRA